jgi:hypothetical protein
MPRRPAKVTQADIARAIRAAKEAGAHSVTIDSEGLIRIELTENTGSNKLKRELDESWTPSEALQRCRHAGRAHCVISSRAASHCPSKLPGVCLRESKADPVEPGLRQGHELNVLCPVPDGLLLGVLVWQTDAYFRLGQALAFIA